MENQQFTAIEFLAYVTAREAAVGRYQRDPLSPPFHVNLILGLRFLQASLLVPWHRRGPVACRGFPG